jgi:hypothetical protein
VTDRDLQALAVRLLTSLRVAASHSEYRDRALQEARGYVAELEAGLDEGKWRCERCGSWLPASVRSCGDCQREVVAKAQERAG